MTTAELHQLFRAAQTSERTYRGLTGPDRFYLYLTAAGTGFRANALANLTPADFDLKPDAPTVTMAARFNKSRKAKIQPLPGNVADALRVYLEGRLAHSPLWGGTWHSGGRMAEMIRLDLEAAGIPYSVEGPDGPEYADFHSLRHSFLTLGGRSGIDLRTLQELAGHSDPILTARYSHRRLYDLAGAVERLPNLVPNDRESMPLRLTGTDNSAVVPAVVEGRISEHLSASNSTLRIVGSMQSEMIQVQQNEILSTDPHRLAPNEMNGPARIRTENQGIMSPLL